MNESNKSIDVKLLTAWLDMMIRDCERTINECPNIGTVKDGSRLGMKIGFQCVKNEIQDFQWVFKTDKEN